MHLTRTPRPMVFIPVLLWAGLLGASCHWSPFADSSPRPSPCDPAASLYIKKQHYISRDFVTEDGTVDYARWFESRKVQSSPCDPVSKSNDGLQPDPKASVPKSDTPKQAPISLPEGESPAPTNGNPMAPPPEKTHGTETPYGPKKASAF